jgi:hypothetical protein
MANISIHDLSITISELVDLDTEQQNAIESALNRAISAKDITGGHKVPVPILAGFIYPLPPKPPIEIC